MPEKLMPNIVASFFSPEKQKEYDEQLKQLASGKPVGLDGVGSFEIAKPPITPPPVPTSPTPPPPSPSSPASRVIHPRRR